MLNISIVSIWRCRPRWILQARLTDYHCSGYSDCTAFILTDNIFYSIILSLSWPWSVYTRKLQNYIHSSLIRRCCARWLKTLSYAHFARFDFASDAAVRVGESKNSWGLRWSSLSVLQHSYTQPNPTTYPHPPQYVYTYTICDHSHTHRSEQQK